MRDLRTHDRDHAIKRGMEFIYEVACDEICFREYGSNLLYFFNFVASTSRDKGLRKMARRMAKERFSQWQRDHVALPADHDASTITDFVLGNHAVERLGVRDAKLKGELKKAARQFAPEDFLWFDPRKEPPPDDIPEVCDCGTINERGRKICMSRKCKKILTMMSRYKIWYIAFTTAYCGERYGVLLGARYMDVIKWLPSMRPYCKKGSDENGLFYDTVYAITHLIYTLNDYGVYKLSRRWLPEEFEFLKNNVTEAIEMEDPDMVGEFLDSLMAFGLTDRHPVVRKGMKYLLSRQNPDGSWGDIDDHIYTRYHTTWAAIDGLREYAWRGERLSFPKLQPMLYEWAKL